MSQNVKEFSLRPRSKFAMFALFMLVGGPMLYAAYLNYDVGETFFSILMVILFLVWAIIILIAVGFKIKLTEDSLHRQGLISPSIIDYSDIKAIHFGSTWSNFYVESEDEQKIFFGKDFENYDQILREIVNKVQTHKDMAEVELLGDPENIDEFSPSN